ncbi:MAG: flagellar biosynthetic protein FliR, partial [Planctomycetota bacterium]
MPGADALSGLESLARSTTEWWVPFLVLWLLVSVRVAGFVLAVPMLTAGLSVRLRLAFVLILAIAITPALATRGVGVEFSGDGWDTAIAAGRELLLGGLIGSIVQLVIVGVQSAGELIAMVSGIGLGQTADPASEPFTGMLPKLVAMLMFAFLLTSGGHRLFLDALL